MELLDIMQHRRSVRSYIEGELTEDQIMKIVQSALLSASGKGRRPWEIYVVTNKELLHKMAGCRVGRVPMLEQAAAAFVVTCDKVNADTWIEDGASALTNMHLMADSLGLGSCWVQGRMRPADDGRSSHDFINELIGFKEGYELLGSLAVGPIKADGHAPGYALDSLPYDKVHRIN